MPGVAVFSRPQGVEPGLAAQIAAHGARLWLHVTGFFSAHFGCRGLEPMREAFAHLAANRGAYVNRQSLAEMAIIYSRYSQDHIDGRSEGNKSHLQSHMPSAYCILYYAQRKTQ